MTSPQIFHADEALKNSSTMAQSATQRRRGHLLPTLGLAWPGFCFWPVSLGSGLLTGTLSSELATGSMSGDSR